MKGCLADLENPENPEMSQVDPENPEFTYDISLRTLKALRYVFLLRSPEI